MRNPKAFRQSILFGGIILVLSYLVFWGPLAFFHVPTISFVDKTKGPLWAIILFLLGGFTPSILGLLMARITDGKKGLKELARRSFQARIGIKWYMLMIAIIAFGGLTQILLAAISGNSFEFALFIQQLPSFIPLIIIGPISEEYGWRGYFLDKLQENFSPIHSAIIVGVVWGLWHLPLFYMTGTSQNVLNIPFISFITSTMATSIIMTYIVNGSMGSVWSAIVFHWIYTYMAQVVSTGVSRTALYNWLEPMPYAVVAIAVIVMWKAGRKGMAKSLA